MIQHRSFGWCFVGAGRIAQKVALDSGGIHIVSVCARHMENARRFAQPHGAAAFTDIGQAASAPGVDAVYVAVQHPEHMACALEALRLGKPVLCEKPLAVNLEQARQMVRLARERGVFLAEAMWPRFNPVLRTVKRWIEEGGIGSVHYVTADFAEAVEDPSSYQFQPSRAGGALLDMGVYPLALAQMVFGAAPESIQASARVEGGVDRRLSLLLEYPGGGTAALFTALDTRSPWTASIHGSRGTIVIPEYWRARGARLIRDGDGMSVERGGCVGWGYQMREVERLISQGAKESPEMPLKESLSLMETMDRIRGQIGVRFPWDV